MSEPVEEYFAEDLLPQPRESSDFSEEGEVVYPKIVHLLKTDRELEAWQALEAAELDHEEQANLWSEAKADAAAKNFVQANSDYIPNQENWAAISAELGNRRFTEANLADAWFRVQRKRTKQSTGGDEFANMTNDELSETMAAVRGEMRRRQR